MNQPTVHNPTNFEPAHYEILDYLDNRRPVYYGQTAEGYAQEVKWWEDELQGIYGADWRKKIHKCVHCGNGNVRWITATKHLPTGEVVTFGCDCTERLGFANQQAFKLAQLKSKAEAGHAKLKIWNQRVKFLEANPAFAEAIANYTGSNSFVKDVISKLNQYGSLSERQTAAVVAAIARDAQKAAQPAVEEIKGEVPVGRVTVTGTLLSTKVVESAYGSTLKGLLKLANNSRIWTTIPAKATVNRGDLLTLAVTVEASKDDKSFGFGSRPSLVKVEQAAA